LIANSIGKADGALVPPRLKNPPYDPSIGEVWYRSDEVVELVVKTIEAQTPDSLASKYSVIGADSVKNRFQMVLRCAAHFQHRIGRMIYLVNERLK
jgi:hypothetical protein